MDIEKDGRIDWIDTAKALGIFLVVLGHHQHILYNYIYSFHMPLFFFISGYLFKTKDLSFRLFVLDKFKRLMIPHFFFSIALFLIWVLFGLIEPNTLNNSNFTKGLIGIFYAQGGRYGYLNWGVISWFLPCLFLVNLFYYYLERFDNLKKWLMIIIFSIIAHLYLRNFTFRFPWSLDVVPQMTIFFGIGNYCHKTQILKKYSFRKFHIIPALLFLNIFFFILNNGRIDIATAIFHNEFFFYLSTIPGIFYFVYISQIIPKSRVLTFIGQNTLPIMLLHFRAYTVINVLLGKSINQDNLVFSVICSMVQILLLLPIILILNTFFPLCIGKNK